MSGHGLTTNSKGELKVTPTPTGTVERQQRDLREILLSIEEKMTRMVEILEEINE